MHWMKAIDVVAFVAFMEEYVLEMNFTNSDKNLVGLSFI